MDISLLRSPNRVATVRIYPSLPESLATVSVKYLDTPDRIQIEAIVAEKVATGVDREQAYNDALGLVAVRGWEGIFDGDKPLAYTPENVCWLMDECGEFRRAVISGATTLRQAVEKN